MQRKCASEDRQQATEFQRRGSKGKHEKTQMDLRFDQGGSVWQKCSRHDLRFVFGGGVCPFCLHERLSSLCLDCSRDLPCPCTPRASVSVGEVDVPFTGVGSVGRVANLIECEPAFRRSKSMAVPFLWSAKPETISETGSDLQPGRVRSLWRLFKGISGETKTKAAAIMRRSRSVAVSDAGEMVDLPAPVTSKGNGWYFPSPIKVFRQSRVSRMMFQQRSPLYRG